MGPVLPVPAWAKGPSTHSGHWGTRRAQERPGVMCCARPRGRARASPGRTGDTGSVQVAGCGGGACSLLGDPGRRGALAVRPPGRLLLGGRQVDASSAAGHLHLWLPEPSPLTRSTNIYLHLQLPRESAPPPWGPDGSREWSSAPEREAGVCGGNRCAPSAPRAAPAEPGATALPGWTSLLEVSPTLCRWPLGPVAGSVGAWPVLVLRGGTRGPGHQGGGH